MSKKVTDGQLWHLIGFIKSSSIRYKTLKSLENDILTPTDIAKKADLTPYNVSRALRDLKQSDLVMCMNERSRKGRIYQNTELGSRILEILEKKTIK